MHSITTILPLIRPEGRFRIKGDDYDELIWLSNDEKPTLDEISKAIISYNKIEAMNRVKIERNFRLEECDWVIVRYIEAGESVHQDWINYRDNLRKFPSTVSPSFNSDGSLAELDWPTRPENLIFADGSSIKFITNEKSHFEKKSAKNKFRTGTK